jgi:outer membrane lipoprotein-sorting protein
MTTTWMRWLPAGVVPAVIAVGAFAVPAQAGAAVDLPEKSPQDVLAMVANSSVDALQGTIEQDSHLGFPELPTMGSPAEQDAAGALELLTGSHTARVFVDGPLKARLQIRDTLGERDLVRSGSDLWFYTFESNTVTHLTLPSELCDDKGMPDTAHGMMAATPEQLAQHFLAAVETSTQVSLGRNTTVANRPAYDLVLTPRASGTLVGSVSISVDADNGLPLGVEVMAKGQREPAFEVAFTDLSLGAPDASLFRFAPPAGATVNEEILPGRPDMQRSPATGQDQVMTGMPLVTGSGWDAVAELPAGALPSEVLNSPLFADLTRNVDGGRLLDTALVNVLFTDDGRVLAGSVPAERLRAVAAGR